MKLHWLKKFCKGDESLEDEEHSGQPSEVDNDKLRPVIEADPITTTQEVAKELSVNRSTVIQHLKQIGKVKRLDKWVPHELTENFFKISGQLMRHPLSELFHLSNLLQMLNDHRMVDIEFLGKFSHSCKRISFDDCQPLRSSSSRLLSPLHKLLEPPLHCTFISNSWAKHVVDVVSCLYCFMIHFELK